MEWFSVPGYEHVPNPSVIDASADYILLLEIKEDVNVTVGSLGKIELKRGWYAYCGSAKAGLWGRVRRHLSRPSKKRWHIDHITKHSSAREVLWKPHEEGGECAAAYFLSKSCVSVRGFGCSDCRCKSHLFYLGPTRSHDEQGDDLV
ncbi:MAG: GIY-YIG nuclease family protein [Candidatus Thermoplasmatota archaeon]|nr:GIY-YIG nuclease family protein [Candidatus Thermoplasmatota archaeon]